MLHTHFLQASGDLTPWRDAIEAEIAAAQAVITTLLPALALDILVQRSPFVIPETGIGGHAYGPTLIHLRLDPANPSFAGTLASGGLRRAVAHEVHHALRMAGPGYGRSLGEALVSEGLAGQFTARLFHTPAEPWERAVDDATLQAHFPTADALADTRYDHNAWFFGTGALPRWFGYTAGFRMVGRWLDGVPGIDAATWITIPAASVLGVGGAY